MVGRAGGGLRREFTADQVKRTHVIKALNIKGATLSQLARANLTFDGQAYVDFDARAAPLPGLRAARMLLRTTSSNSANVRAALIAELNWDISGLQRPL